ncbi:hypothetical protein ACFS2C_18955 [Prauserella oleivorans]|uniref:Mce-associated membrane protein n=1 Tax=Prauserella oleivorans TaxID=1478153 RepID=A0ABW5WFY3_9PSEU
MRAPGKDRLVPLMAVAALVAVLCCAGFGRQWWSAAEGDFGRRGAARDAAVRDGTHALTVLNTIDHRRAEPDVDEWLTVTTGQLQEDLKNDRDLHIDRARQGRTVATASVTQAALSDLDEPAGTARLLAVVRVELGGQPKRSALVADLVRAGDTWKVSAVQAAGR